MHRPAALLVTLLLALAACSGDGQAAPPPEPVPTATPGQPAEPAPVPTPATPQPEEDLPQLAPGRTDGFVVPGAPMLLALGDSLAAGTGLADLREGFVWRLHAALAEERGEEYGLTNLAVPGATSQDLLAEQLPAALEALAGEQVDTILLSVGGNDLLGLFAGGCRDGLGTPECDLAVDDAVAAFADNLDLALADLRAAAQGAPIVLLAVYNPFDLGMGSQLESLAAQAAVALNAAAAEVAPRHGVRVADGYAALEGRIAADTGMGAAQPDIHPTPLGHDRLALTILDALRG